jgi:Co/Zn/Cd efflux system component
LLAYAAARRYAGDRRFAFGTWKIEILGGYSSALLLLGVAGLMAFQSVERLLVPGQIHYDEAILIAVAASPSTSSAPGCYAMTIITTITLTATTITTTTTTT